MNKSLLFVFTIFLFTGCTPSQKLQNFSKSNLIFGSGGGITGATNEYTLKYDGVINKLNSLTNETTQVTTISAKDAKALFRDFLSKGLDTLNFSVPGNMSQFIGFKNDSITHKIIWGGDTNPPAEAKAYYESLIQLINNQ
jgi:uncharacterized lipoprotein YajG